MKLKDIEEIGFYKELDSEDIWEAFKNTDKDEYWRKGEPILLDWWHYTGVDMDDRKTYEVDGLIYHIGSDYPEKEVEKLDQKFIRYGSYEENLIENNPTYREKYNDLLERYSRLLDKYEELQIENRELREENEH